MNRRGQDGAPLCSTCPREARAEAEAVVLAVHKISAALAPSLVVVQGAMVAFARKIDEVQWTAYRDAGAPYGDSLVGRQRWLRELVESAEKS